MLLVVLGMLSIAYAWPVRELVAQRQQLAQTASDVHAAEARIAALNQTEANFSDPAYIEQQARAQLHFVMPGETPFTVVRPGGPVPDRTLPKSQPPVQAWYQNLWSSVRGANMRPGASPKR
jgi:Septum formation initiator